MNVVVFDRALMGTSLAVHIVLASIGIALPVIMLLLEYLSIRYKDSDYAVMAKRLSIVFIVFFAVGTASGMLVAVNITVLWPKFITRSTRYRRCLSTRRLSHSS